MAKKVNILLACSLFLLAACSDTTNTEEQVKTDSTVSEAPFADSSARNTPSPAVSADINQYLQAAMPGWSVPESSEWEKYWYDRYKKDRNTVYRVEEDFDGNGQSDYAFILKDTAGKYAVWAFLGNVGNYIPHRIYDITRLPGQKLHVGLDRLKAGTYDDLNTAEAVPAKVKTEHPAVHIIFFETAAKAYYWKDSTFHLIQTGD